jgi:hypothetical protein
MGSAKRVVDRLHPMWPRVAAVRLSISEAAKTSEFNLSGVNLGNISGFGFYCTNWV